VSRQKVTPEPKFTTDVPSLGLIKGGKGSAPSQSQSPIDLRSTRVEEFLGANALSPNTQRAYRQDLKVFLEWTNTGWETVTPLQVEKFKEYISTSPSAGKTKGKAKGKPRSSATISRILGTLKNFYQWLLDSEYVTRNPTRRVKAPKLPEPEAQNLSIDQVKRIIEATAQTNLETRNLALIAVLLHGLRAGEVSSLNVSDYEGERVRIRKAKADSKGKVPLAKEGQQAVDRYLQWRKERGDILEPDSPLFLSHSRRNDGDRLTYDAIHNIVSQISELSGIDFHAHQLRHTFATNMVLEGMNPQHVMVMTRHKSSSSFKRYITAAEQQAAEKEFRRFEG